MLWLENQIMAAIEENSRQTEYVARDSKFRASD